MQKNRWQQLCITLVIHLVILFSLLAYGAIQSWAITGISVLLLPSCLLVLAIYWLKPVAFSFHTGMEIPIILALLLSVISVFHTVYLYISLESTYIFFLYVIFFFLAYFSFRTQKMMLVSLYLLLAMAFIYAIVGLLLINHLFFDDSFYHQSRALSLSFSFVSHNQFAAFMQVDFWLALPLIHLYKGSKRTILLAITTVFAITMLLSLSRGAWMAFAVSSVFFFVLLPSSNKRHWLWLPIFSMVLFLLMSDNTLIMHRMFSMYDLNDASETRVQCWIATWQYILNYFWLGSGSGTYQYVFLQYESEILADIFFKHAHNSYLEFFAEFGLLGIITLFTFLYYLYVPAIRFITNPNNNKKKDRLFKHICLGSLTACTSMLVHDVVDFSFHVPANTFIFIFCVTVVMACVRQSEQPTQSLFSTPFTRPFLTYQWCTILLLILIIAASWFSIQNFRAEHMMDQARQAIKAHQWKKMLSQTQQAVAFVPYNIHYIIALADALQARATQMRIDYDQDAYLMASLKTIEKAIEEFSSYGILWYKKSILLQLLGKPQEALKSLQQSALYLPAQSYIHQDLAFALLKASRFDEAAIELSTTLRIKPQDAAVLFPIIWQYKPSIDYLQSLLNNNATLYTQAARLLLNKGFTKSGIILLKKAFDLNNVEWQASKNILLLWQTGNKGEAIYLGQEYLRIWPRTSSLVYQMAGYYFNVQMIDQAKELLLRYLKVEENNQQMYRFLLQIYMREQEYSAAIELIQEKLKAETTAYNYQLLAQIYSNLGQLHKALRAIKSGISIDKTNPQLQYHAGLLYQQLNMEALAISHWRQCEDVEPSCQKALLDLRIKLGLVLPQ